jgi:glucose/mannose transport system substrate-binding protein
VHLYDLDALAMLRSRDAPIRAQRQLAAIAMSPEVQDRYNRAKGSVPVIRRPDLEAMDSCARESWNLLARPGAVLVPGIVVGMTGDESMRNALVSELQRFFTDDHVDVLDTQQRLAVAGRAIKRTRLP